MNEFAVKQVAMVCVPTLAGLDIVERKCDVKIVRTVLAELVSFNALGSFMNQLYFEF